MIKRILILVALISIKVGAFANSTVKDTLLVERLMKLAGYGNQKLKDQVARNTENDRKNLHQLNNYIIDFSDFEKADTTDGFNDLSPLLGVGGTYVGADVLNATNIEQLNSYLVTANSSTSTDIYIAVNLRLGLILETKEIKPELLNDIDNEAATSNIAQITFQNYQQVRDNHALIKTHFDGNLAAGVSGDYVLFTWGKYYKVAEVPTVSNASHVGLKLYSGGHYRFYYDHASSITGPTSEKITAYVESATDFPSLPRKTAAELVGKYRTVIDGLKAAIAKKNVLDNFLLEGTIQQNNLKKVGKYVLTKYYNRAKGEGALSKLVELAVYMERFDTAMYNGYVNGVRDHLNPLNYWFRDDDAPDAGGLNKDNIANFLEKVKDYNDAFLIIKYNAKNGIITKTEFKEYFNKHLIWGGDAKRNIHPNVLSLLSANEKVNILKAIAKDLSASYFNRSIQGFARDEDLVISILGTTPKENTKLVLNALKSTKLLYELIDKFTQRDFDNIIEGLSMWIFYNYPVQNEKKKLSDPATAESTWLTYLEKKRAIYFNNNYFGRRNNEEMEADGDIHVIVKKWFNSQAEYELAVDPYKYVLVRFENDFEIAGSKFVKGQTCLLPALTVYMLFVQDTRDKWLKTGKIVIDVALCAVGIGEINAAIKLGKWGRFALATLDLGIGVGDIVINTAFEEEIRSEYPNFFATWQKISLAYGLGRLAQVGIESAIKEAYADSYIIRRSDEFSDETRAFAERVNNKLSDPEQFSEFSDDIQLDNIWPREPHAYIEDVVTKVQAKRDHILTIDWKNAGHTKFTGCHHQSALDAVGEANYEKLFISGDPHGVYEAQIMVKNDAGQWITKSGNGGISTFFPDSWDPARVLDEVEYAIKNNLGRVPGSDNPEFYYGLSKDNNIKIGFYLKADRTIGSYFPIMP